MQNFTNNLNFYSIQIYTTIEILLKIMHATMQSSLLHEQHNSYLNLIQTGQCGHHASCLFSLKCKIDVLSNTDWPKVCHSWIKCKGNQYSVTASETGNLIFQLEKVQIRLECKVGQLFNKLLLNVLLQSIVMTRTQSLIAFPNHYFLLIKICI